MYIAAELCLILFLFSIWKNTALIYKTLGIWSLGGRNGQNWRLRHPQWCADAPALSVLSGVLKMKISWFSFPKNGEREKEIIKGLGTCYYRWNIMYNSEPLNQTHFIYIYSEITLALNGDVDAKIICPI